MISAVPSVREVVGEADRFVPILAHRDEDHPDAGQGLQPFDIAPGVPREVLDLLCPTDILRPAVQLLVAGPAMREEAQVGGNGFGELLLLRPVAGADLQFFNPGQDVEFGQGDPGDA